MFCGVKGGMEEKKKKKKDELFVDRKKGAGGNTMGDRGMEMSDFFER